MEYRDTGTDNKAIKALESPGGLSPGNAFLAVQILNREGFVVKELRADAPLSNSTEPPEEIPVYGSLKSIYKKLDQITRGRDELNQQERKLAVEYEHALRDLHPIFAAIKQAVEATDGSSDPLSGPDA